MYLIMISLSKLNTTSNRCDAYRRRLIIISAGAAYGAVGAKSRGAENRDAQTVKKVENVDEVSLSSHLEVWRSLVSFPSGVRVEPLTQAHFGEVLTAKTLLTGAFF